MNLTGIPLLYAAASMFAIGSVFIKLSADTIGGVLVSGIRFVVGIALCATVMVATRTKVRPNKPALVLARGLFGAASMAFTYLAIALTGPGRATLLSNTYPIVVALVAAILFRERLRIRTIVALALCAVGAFFVVRDGSGASLAGDIFALLSALFAGFAVNFVRQATPYESPFLLYLAPCIFGLPVLFFGGIFAGPLDPTGLALAVVVGVFAFGAQIAMALGYRHVPAGRGSVVFYFETALTMVFGAMLGERPNGRFFVGLALIATGLVLNHLAPERTKAT